MAEAARELFDHFVGGKAESVMEAVATQEPENVFLDFKENRDASGALPRLTEHNKVNLGKALSAFANTSGGVLVWGVEAKDRKAYQSRPIPDIVGFVRSLQTATITAVNPPVLGVEHRYIETDDGAGYAVTYIPESHHKPHQCIVDPARNYWIRNADSMGIAEHPVVRSLFMERVRPELKVRSEFIDFRTNKSELRRDSQGLPRYFQTSVATLSVSVSNEGEAIAEKCAVALECGEADSLSLPFENRRVLREGKSHYSKFVILPVEALYPGNEIVAFTLRANLQAHDIPGSADGRDYVIRGTAYSIGFSEQFEIRVAAEALHRASMGYPPSSNSH